MKSRQEGKKMFSAIFAAVLTCGTLLTKQILYLIAYVSNTNSFPQPLNSKEEKYYLEKFKNGDLEAKNILIERNLRLVAHIAKKYTLQGKDNDDLISIGAFGLIKAINSFDLDKGNRLAAFAAKCVENEIRMYLRAEKKKQNEVSLQEPIGVDGEGNEVCRMDIMKSDGEAVLDEVATKIQIKKLQIHMAEVLKGREKLVLQLRYGLLNGNPKTQREIAKMLGISRSYVSRIEKRAIEKLEKKFVDEDY